MYFCEKNETITTVCGISVGEIKHYYSALCCSLFTNNSVTNSPGRCVRREIWGANMASGF